MASWWTRSSAWRSRKWHRHLRRQMRKWRSSKSGGTLSPVCGPPQLTTFTSFVAFLLVSTRRAHHLTTSTTTRGARRARRRRRHCLRVAGGLPSVRVRRV